MTGEDKAPRLYFEDLDVGRRFTTGSVTMEPEAIKAFAASFDPQPFHLDDEAAKASFFGGLVASGWHTASVTMRLLVTSGLPIAGGVIGAGGDIVWPRAVRPGDTLSVVSEVVAAKPSASRPERGMVTVRSETRNQDGEVVQIMTARLVVPTRASTY
ncbi:MaoC family dehydratase [Hyphomicrobium sp.]|uniref:MaoC family dehydratase n=1 Tax=Hyphomicrobium sp. TaxID=82 RepID=UPI002CE92991|nr:MaoC family dehydratase [Hyphomicrobium sp.]HRN89384.1 MaoC family dehydratase [Hyphomicrobium sp.]HRQ27545.1 MaoC family dehydratase [Hyphomicrobium sp.]